jgi:hypothetical protein
LNPLLLLGIAAAVGIISVTSFVVIRNYREKQKILPIDAQRIEDLFEDILKISHLFIIHAKSGLNLFYRSYGVEPFKPNLVSGFLTALSQFAEELGETEDGYTTHSYQGKSISVVTCGILRAAFVGETPISERYRRYSLRVLSTTKEDYENLLSAWDGSMQNILKVGIEIEQKLGLPLFHVPLIIEDSPSNGDLRLNLVFNRISEYNETVHLLTLKRISDNLGKKFIKPTMELLKKGNLKAQVELDFLTGEFDTPPES